MNLNLILLIFLLLFALAAVLTKSLIKSAICFALTSVLLTIIMFKLNSPLAAVFELSICAGLITVIFISTISLTKPFTEKELKEYVKGREKRYLLLPVIILIVIVLIILLNLKISTTHFKIIDKSFNQNVRDILWLFRQLDILGQIIILLAGVFGVAVFFKETKDE